MKSGRLTAALILLATVHSQSLNASWISQVTGINIDLAPPIKAPQPPLPQPAQVDAAVLKAFNKAQVVYYEQYTKSLASTETTAHTQAVYQWQLSSSKFVFYIVIAIVISGLVLCWLQFFRSSTAKEPGKATDIRISGTGLKVSSPVMGVIVLAMSLAFFFCYLQFVYPIRITDQSERSRASVSKIEAGMPVVPSR